VVPLASSAASTSGYFDSNSSCTQPAADVSEKQHLLMCVLQDGQCSDEQAQLDVAAAGLNQDSADEALSDAHQLAVGLQQLQLDDPHPRDGNSSADAAVDAAPTSPGKGIAGSLGRIEDLQQAMHARAQQQLAVAQELQQVESNPADGGHDASQAAKLGPKQLQDEHAYDRSVGDQQQPQDAAEKQQAVCVTCGTSQQSGALQDQASDAAALSQCSQGQCMQEGHSSSCSTTIQAERLVPAADSGSLVGLQVRTFCCQTRLLLLLGPA
jgi:hypothetical protein